MRTARFAGLDGMRGVAALGVLAGHTATLLGYKGLAFGHAVDLFFLMSGFVIPHAYERKLKDGLSFLSFMRVRVIRLYPLYILGVAVSFIPYVVWAVEAGKLSFMREPLAMLGWALLMLPQPHLEPEHSFLLNPPAWSLFREMVINAAYAIFLPWLGRRMLMVVLIASLCGLAIAVGHFGTVDFGTGGVELLWGLFRVTFPFTLGVVLYRLWKAGRLTGLCLNPLVPALLYGLSVVVLTVARSGWLEFLVVTALVPIIAVLAINSPPSGRLATAFDWLGDLSYPLYALHIPLLIAPRQLLGSAAFAGWSATALSLLVVLVVAALMIFPDKRVRRALTGRRLAAPRPQTAP